jgi:Prolyl oligopeptidase family
VPRWHDQDLRQRLLTRANAGLHLKYYDPVFSHDGKGMYFSAYVRVAPLHSYKFAAALQAAQAGSARIVLRVDTQSGHGGGATLLQRVARDAEVLAFFAYNLGMKLP